MTDAEARDQFEGGVVYHKRIHPSDSEGCQLCAAFRHALVALADRAALCADVRCGFDLEQRAEAFAAARRHMEGK